MRAQIRGLNKANENIQDGISFVKIGEGGMQEVHSILHRIRELSVKAANGTNAQEDRAAIQSEIDALCAEINDIAYKTSFNEHYMLCGGSGRAAGSSGGTGSVIDPAVSDALSKRVTYGGSQNDSMGSVIYNPDGTLVICGSTSSSDKDLDGAGSGAGGSAGWVTKVGTDGEILWATKVEGGSKGFNSITATTDGEYFAAGGDNGRPLLTKLDANGNITWTYEFQGSTKDTHVNNAFLMQDGSGHILLSIQTFDYNNIKDGNGNPLGGSTLGGRDTIMMVIDPLIDPNTDYSAFEKKAYRVGGSSNEQISRLYLTSDGGYIGGNYTTSTVITQSNNDGTSSKPPTTTIGNGSHHAYIVKFDKHGNTERVLLFGDSAPIYHNSGENISQIIETSSGEYLVVGNARITDTVGTTAPSTDESRGKNIWVMKMDKNLNPIWSRTYGSSQDDAGHAIVETANGFVVAGRVGAVDGDVSKKSGYTGASAWVFMVDKNSGDIIWNEVHGGSGSDSFNTLFEDANGDILLGGSSSSDDEDLAGKNKGGTDAWFLKLDGLTGGNVHASGGSGGSASSFGEKFIYLRTGPLCGDHFRIDYADMRTSTIFGKGAALDVMSQSAADKTMTLCDRAIEYVSRQRSLYGSYENALEHLYNANANTSENVSMSESMIADADIAREMVEFSCSQILEQMNISVLSQANTAHQSALKLLEG